MQVSPRGRRHAGRRRRAGRDGDRAQPRRAARHGLRRARRRPGRTTCVVAHARPTTTTASTPALAAVADAARRRCAATGDSGGGGDDASPRARSASAARPRPARPSPSSRCPAQHAFDRGDRRDRRRACRVMLFSDNVSVERRGAAQGRRGRAPTCWSWAPTAAPPSSAGSPSASPTSCGPGSVGIVAASRHRRAAGDVPARRGRGRAEPLPRRRRAATSRPPSGAARPGRRCAALAADPATEPIVVVSKPPDAAVLAEVEAYAAELGHAGALGRARPGPARPHRGRRGVPRGRGPRRCRPGRRPWRPASDAPGSPAAALRGLFCGGTLADEAMIDRGGRRSGGSAPTSRSRPSCALGPDLRRPRPRRDRLRRRRAHPRPRPPDDRPDAAAGADRRRGRRPDVRRAAARPRARPRRPPRPGRRARRRRARGARGGPRRRPRAARRRVADRHRRRPAGPVAVRRGAAPTPAPRCSCPTPPPPGTPLDLARGAPR